MLKMNVIHKMVALSSLDTHSTHKPKRNHQFTYKITFSQIDFWVFYATGGWMNIFLVFIILWNTQKKKQIRQTNTRSEQENYTEKQDYD